MALVFFLTALGCKQSDGKAAKTSARTDPLKVQTTPELLKNITIGNPEWKEVTSQQKVAARVQTDASRVARIGSPSMAASHGFSYSKARKFAKAMCSLCSTAMPSQTLSLRSSRRVPKKSFLSNRLSERINLCNRM